MHGKSNKTNASSSQREPEHVSDIPCKGVDWVSCMFACSIKDILYKKRMERELLRAKGLLKEAEKPPEEVRVTANTHCHALNMASKHGLCHVHTAPQTAQGGVSHMHT